MQQGLMQRPGAAPQPPVDDEAAEPMPDDEMAEGEEEGEPASAQEQAQYDEIMGAFMGMIHSPKTRDQIVSRIKAGKDNPGAAIGEMALPMYESVEAQITKAQGQIEDSVRQETMQDLVMELVEVAVAAGIVPDDEERVGATASAALDVFASAYGKSLRDRGVINPDVAARQLEELKPQAMSRFGGPPSGKKPLAEAVKGGAA